MNWSVPRIWEGGECFIIGGGDSVPSQFGIPADLAAKVRRKELPPSALSPYMGPIHNRHVIGINNAYMLGDWLDVCFFGDCGWYLVHRKALAIWRNLKVTCCPRFANKSREQQEGIKYLAKDSSKRHGMSDNPRTVSWNSNSGAAAISLAAHFGVARIILLGFDMSLGAEGSSHWDGGHGNGRKPPFERHLRGFPAIAEDAARRGIEILNASPLSVIAEFPKVSLKEVL